MDYPRTLSQHLLDCSATFGVLLVTGARQVGKTTLLRTLSGPERTYVTLDDPLVLALAKSDPALFVQRYAPPVLIDEVQYAPELLPHIKMRVDAAGATGGAKDEAKGLYWLTGSQPFHLMRGVSESLAGRVAVVHMLGLSRQEALGLGDTAFPPFLPTDQVLAARRSYAQPPLEVDALFAQIWRGSFPALVRNPRMGRDIFFSSYLQTYVQRDVRALARVGDELAFMRFVGAAAARTGQLLNMADLARDADISPNTAKQWLSVLEASGLVFLLQPWHSNTTKRLIKTPKLYFLDTGFCAYLTRWSSAQALEAGAMAGAIFETWVVVEILKSYWHTGRNPQCYYYRSKDGYEIDLLIEQDGFLHPIECKKSASPSRQALQGFKSLGQPGVPMAQGAVLCLVPDALPLSPTIQALNVAYL